MEFTPLFKTTANLIEFRMQILIFFVIVYCI